MFLIDGVIYSVPGTGTIKMSWQKPQKRENFEYQDKKVGEAFLHAGVWVFRWYQNPFRLFSNNSKTVYGMQEGLLKKLEESEFSFIFIDDEYISIDKLRDYVKIPPKHHAFDEEQDEWQYLITIEKN